MKAKKRIITLAFCLGCFLVSYLFIDRLLPIAQPRMQGDPISKVETLHYVALGDSLTEGVGDTSNQGGFVSLLAQSLTNRYKVQVVTENAGVAGNTSAQILARMQKKKEIQIHLQAAQLMTLTVGGNDLRNAVLDHITDFHLSDLEEARENYQQNLIKIIEQARKENPQLPIYILGIYNPFYLNFSDVKEIQEVVDQWNALTEQTISDYKGVYFVPINDVLYQGVDGQARSTEKADGRTILANDALYAEDRFHPNHTGYEKINEVVMKRIEETKNDWSEE